MNDVDIIAEELKKHIGPDNPITSRDLAAILGLVEEDTFARTRKLVRDAMTEYRLPLGSQTSGDYAGYFIINDDDLLQEQFLSLIGRAKKIGQRARLMVEFYASFWKKDASFVTSMLKHTQIEEYSD